MANIVFHTKKREEKESKGVWVLKKKEEWGNRHSLPMTAGIMLSVKEGTTGFEQGFSWLRGRRTAGVAANNPSTGRRGPSRTDDRNPSASAQSPSCCIRNHLIPSKYSQLFATMIDQNHTDDSSGKDIAGTPRTSKLGVSNPEAIGEGATGGVIG